MTCVTGDEIMPHIQGESGIDWHYDLEGEGEILLFLHGWGVDKRIWRQQTKHFSQMYKVLSIDLPGHGKSSWVKTSLEVMAKDMQSILVHLQLQDITVVCSSLGGLFALKLYGEHSEEFKRLIFVGSMPKFSKSEDYPYGLDVAKMRKLTEQLELSYPEIVNIFFRSLFTKEERQTRRYKWLQKFRQRTDVPLKGALVEYLDILEHEDLRDILKSVTCPMQFIKGTDDEICDRKTIEFLQEFVPKARFDLFDKCGHFPFLSKPYLFNKVLTNFLEIT